MPSSRSLDAAPGRREPGPLGAGTATLLALTAAAILGAADSLPVRESWSHLVEQGRPWLIAAAALLALVVRRSAVVVHAALSVSAVLLLALTFGSVTHRGEDVLALGTAGVLLMTAGVLGAAAGAPAAARARPSVATLVLAWFGTGLWLLGIPVRLAGEVVREQEFDAGRLLALAGSAVLVVVLLRVLRRGASRWIGGALIGAGTWMLSFQAEFLHILVAAATGGGVHRAGGYGPSTVPDLLSGPFLILAGVTALISRGPVRRLAPRDESRPACDDTTRALCAAMHLDRTIGRRVAEEVLDRVTRGIAPSWGVNVGLVVRHCLWAVRRQMLRDAALAVTVALALTAWVAGWASGAETPGPVIAAVLLAPWAIIAVERWIAIRTARSLRRGRPCPLPRLGDEDEALARAVEAAEAGNIMSFDGYFPFVGSGTETGGWSFALEIPDPATAVRPQDLYDEICHGLNRLGVEGLTFDDRLYVDAEEVPAGSDLWTADEVPVLRTHAGDEELTGFVENPVLHHRVYRCVRVNGWRGEYVLSVFLNIERRAGSLFVSARYFLLRPVEPRYAAMVRGADPEENSLSAAAFAEMRNALALYFASIPATVSWVSRAARRRPGAARDRTAHPAVPHQPGSGQRSVREIAQGSRFRRYFQQLDWEMTTKLLERELLAGLARALRTHGVDTAELEKRQTAILNYGVIVNGGELKAGTMAVGKGARSSRLTRIVSAALVREEGAKR